MTPELKQCLTEWLEWAEAGAPEHPVFVPYLGLCANVGNWSSDESLFNEILQMIDGQSYPFGKDDYFFRRANQTLHECPNRLAWVREQLGRTS